MKDGAATVPNRIGLREAALQQYCHSIFPRHLSLLSAPGHIRRHQWPRVKKYDMQTPWLVLPCPCWYERWCCNSSKQDRTQGSRIATILPLNFPTPLVTIISSWAHQTPPMAAREKV